MWPSALYHFQFEIVLFPPGKGCLPLHYARPLLSPMVPFRTGNGITHDIFTRGNTWEELLANVREAVFAFFFYQRKAGVANTRVIKHLPAKFLREKDSHSQA
jgi:hypothetical protein